MLCFLILAWWGTNHILCFSTSLRWCQNIWKVLECSSGPPFSSLSLSLAVLCSISFFTQSFYLFHHMSLDMWYPVSQIGVLILYIGSSVFTSSQRFIKRMCVFGCSVVSLSVTPWTVAHQAPLSLEFSSQEYWKEVLRWWRNRTGRSLSPPQIHQKNIQTLSKIPKTTECQQKTSGTQKSSPLSSRRR